MAKTSSYNFISLLKPLGALPRLRVHGQVRHASWKQGEQNEQSYIFYIGICQRGTS